MHNIGDFSAARNLIQSLFQYLLSRKEYTYLREKTSATLVKYYESRKHVKKNLQAGGFSDLRREIQTKTHLNIGPDLDGYKGEVCY